MEKERKGEERDGRGKRREETGMGMYDGAEAKATVQDQDMANAADKPQVLGYLMDDAVKILVRDATEAFGFAPRDVCRAILKPQATKEKHENAIRALDYLALKALVREFNLNKALSELSRRVVAVNPRRIDDHTDHWTIDFKSVRIADQIIEWMRVQEENHLWEIYDSFHKYPEGSNLAGWAFEAIVHRVFSNGWRPGPDMPQPILMTESKNPPIFSVNPSSSPTNSVDSYSSLADSVASSSSPTNSVDSSPSPINSMDSFSPSSNSVTSPLRTHTRTVVRVKFNHAYALNVTLRDNRYCIPISSNSPLFDSFIIDVDEVNATAVISIIQITISKRHHGSSKGYSLIHKIMNTVRKLIKERIPDKKVDIRVVYFLVCPDDEVDHTWQMPTGWDETTTVNDHRGGCYLLRIPTSYLRVCRVYSLLSSRPG